MVQITVGSQEYIPGGTVTCVEDTAQRRVWEVQWLGEVRGVVEQVYWDGWYAVKPNGARCEVQSRRAGCIWLSAEEPKPAVS